MKFSRSLLFGAGLCLASMASVNAAEPVKVETRPFVLKSAQQFDLKSQANGRNYRIFLSIPQGEAPAEGFPVIYTTDGNAMFPQLSATAHLLYLTHRVVLVGVGYQTDELYDAGRNYDLTPKRAENAAGENRRGGGEGGGGNDIFLDFIEKEVKPQVESRVKVNRQQQTLLGHSFGGLFALHALFTRPESFQNYIAAAPSVWYNGGTAMQEKAAFIEKYKGQKLNLKVLITANTEPARQRPVAQNTDAAPATNRPVRQSAQSAIEGSVSIIDDLKTIEGITAEAKVFENETHMSMVPGSINSGLRFLFGDGERERRQRPAGTARGGAQNAN